MSFSRELKEELSKTDNLSNKEEVRYELIGYLISNHINIEKNKIRFSTENEYNINRFSRLLSNMQINDFDISVQGKVFEIVFEYNDFKSIDFTSIPQEQYKWIIRGAYLGGGSINNPEKKYHLEISFKENENAIQILNMLKNYDIKSNIIQKKKEYVVYIKDGEEISKVIALMGANKSVIKFEEIRVQREMNNKINRIVNCETANLNKTINASIEQIEAIRKLKKNNEFERLDDTLKEIAEIRIQNPNLSLSELGKKLKKPIGKSGVNYRLKKIMEIANGK